MSERRDIGMSASFYRNHKLRNPGLVLFLILFSFGIYILWWFCLITRELNEIDKNSPSQIRALYIFVLIPFSLIIINFVLSFSKLPLFLLSIISNWGWAITIALMLKFLFDFCVSYGEFTKSEGIYWFLGYFAAFFGLIALALGNLYLSPLILIFPIIAPAMQAQFNFWVDRLNLKKKSNAFYF